VRGRGRKFSLWVPAKTHEDLLGAATPRASAMPPSATNSIILPQTGGIRNQQQSPWCTGFTLAESLSYAYVGQTGTPIEYSAMCAYMGGKLFENYLAGLPTTAPINDNGAAFNDLLLAAQAQGVCLESLMPFNPALLQQKENYVQVADANTRKLRVGECGAVTGTGQAYINGLCQSLLPYADGKIGRTVPIGIASSYPEFDNADGSTILVAPPTGLSVDHEVELVDYDTVTGVSNGVVTLSSGKTFADPSSTIQVGSRCFRLQNHWDLYTSACDIPGTVWVAESFMLGQQGLGGDAVMINAEVSS
jgi:hypothetical protein